MNKRPSEWTTLRGRVEWMLDFYDQHGVSARELCRRAGLNETTLGTAVARWKKRPDADHTLETLVRMRRALNVPWPWFAENIGWPSDDIRQRMGGAGSDETPPPVPTPPPPPVKLRH